MMNSNTLIAASLFAASTLSVFGADNLTIIATEAFNITGNNTGRHDNARMLVGGWPDNAGWGIDARGYGL